MKAFKSTGTIDHVRIDFISCIDGPLCANQRVLKSQPVSAADAMFDHIDSFSAEKNDLNSFVLITDKRLGSKRKMVETIMDDKLHTLRNFYANVLD